MRTRTRSSTRCTVLSVTLGVALGAGCASDDLGSPDAAEATLATPTAVTTPALIPPEPYVMADDGVTELTLAQAGIYRPGGAYWAKVLGKALFYDEQAGSDGNSCGSCHFHAGADPRVRNQLNPGFNDLRAGPGGDTTFGSSRSDTGDVLPGHMPSGALADSNYVLQPEDMPLHKLQDETDRNSPVVTTTNDRVSSLGAFAGTFNRVGHNGRRDRCGPPDASVFHAGPYAARQVEPRNTPTFHNAAFQHRNFWDLRANNLFTGLGVFGLREVLGDPADPYDPRHDNRIVVIEHGKPKLTYLKVENASTASQAVGPPLSALEMSCDGRHFPDVARKLLFSIPLHRQRISKHDSLLGPYVSRSGKGLRLPYLYSVLIMKTFSPKYWALPGRYRIVHGKLVKDPHGYSQLELNFSMFWGLAIQAYELTQVSDRSEIDALQAEGRLVMRPAFVPAGPNVGGCTSPTGDVDPLLLRGCTIFMRFNPNPALPTPPDGVRGGNCFVCHNAPGGGVGRPVQPLLSEAAFQHGEVFPLFLTVGDASGFNDLRDNGTANIGLRDVESDRMMGNTDPYGNPLSYGRQLWNYLDGVPGAVLDPPLQRLIDAGGAPTRVGLTDPTPGGTFRKLESDGASKAPILRNVALTAPYFSWGGYPSLRQVLKVYNRGMNRRDISGPGSADAHGSACSRGDDSGTGPDGNQGWPVLHDDCGTNTTGLIVPLGLSDCDANGAPNAACLARGHTAMDDDLAALERFLKALTDYRVQCDKAPFDRPELHILAGHRDTDWNHDGKGDDIVFTLPAVGASGYSPWSGYCIPNAGDLFAPGMQARAGGAKAPPP